MTNATVQLRKVEQKWQDMWAAARTFEARADYSRPKYFLNVPYPYMNGYLHIGFGVTFLHADIMARFKRMQGFNVLFPQSFHCTGMPLLAAANLVKERNPEQVKILKDMGIPESRILSFSDPYEWTRFFPEAAREDLQDFGASVDWTRSFITTELNPAYDQFVKWQFRRLLKKGYVKTGKHAVVWCPKDQQPVADHDRFEGEGEIPVEFTLLKFPLDGKFLVAATLRPETVFGQTNLWIDPEVVYAQAEIDGERWVLSRGAMEKLREQDKKIELIGEVRGEDFVGRECEAPMLHRPIPILPTRFIDQSKGTGIVTSVPSDAPDDWIALKTLKEDVSYVRKYGLDIERLKSISPVPIIRTEGWGPLPAVEVCEKMRITSLDQREMMEKAKEEVYASGFYKGIMNDSCGRFAGMRVSEAKEEIKQEMIEKGEASSLWEASGEVVCRCRTPATVRVVSDQWFLAYSDSEWKALTAEALKRLALYPETVRKQLQHVLDWLNDWACTHHVGLGTKLPWDDRWLIESLSDSTIYMAYYTIAHFIGVLGFDPSVLTDSVFDYVFLGGGRVDDVLKESHIAPETLDEMKREFEYWYPFDLRHSGKDLVQNHLIFCLFNHTAMFPETLWPKAFGINGFVKIGAARMSKSHGVATYLRDVIHERGADVVRLTLVQGGEGLDDPSYDDDFAVTVGKRLLALLDYATQHHETRKKAIAVDAWFRSVLHRTIAKTVEAMEGMMHRTAIKHGYFDLQRHWTWYLRRCGGIPSEDVLREYLDVQTRMLSPFTPHLAEEMWEATGHKGFVCTEKYPMPDSRATNDYVEASEVYVQRLLEDVAEIVKVTRLRPKSVNVFVAPAWKRQAYEMAVGISLRGKLEMSTFMHQALESPDLKARTRELAAFAPRIIEIIRKMSREELKSRERTLDELALLEETRSFLESEFGCTVSVRDADAQDLADPKKKASQAIPWKPAIYVE